MPEPETPMQKVDARTPQPKTYDSDETYGYQTAHNTNPTARRDLDSVGVEQDRDNAHAQRAEELAEQSADETNPQTGTIPGAPPPPEPPQE